MSLRVSFFEIPTAKIFSYFVNIKPGLQDVLLDAKTGAIYRQPDGSLRFEQTEHTLKYLA